MKKTNQGAPQRRMQDPTESAGEKRSGEGSASALVRLRLQEKAEAMARALKRTPRKLGF